MVHSTGKAFLSVCDFHIESYPQQSLAYVNFKVQEEDLSRIEAISSMKLPLPVALQIEDLHLAGVFFCY